MDDKDKWAGALFLLDGPLKRIISFFQRQFVIRKVALHSLSYKLL